MLIGSLVSGSKRRDSCASNASNSGIVNLSPARAKSRPTDWILGTTIGQWTILLLTGVFLVFSGTLVWYSTPGTNDFPADTLYQSLWMSYTLWADVGTQTGLTAADPGICSTVVIIFSFLGFVYNLALLGLVVDVIRDQLAYWKQEMSRVNANDHVLILGWGDKTLYLLHELFAADQLEEHGRRRASCMGKGRRRQIVILADRPVHDMSQDVKTFFKSRIKEPARRRMVYQNMAYRQGDPTDQAELLKVSVSSAQVILAMGGSDYGSSDESVMMTLLALAALQLEYHLSGDVFAEMQTYNTVRVMKDIFPMAEGIVARHAVNRMLILRALVPSVGFAFLELASFNRGNEFYTVPVAPELIGVPFDRACRLLPDAVICGVMPGKRDDVTGMDLQALIPKKGQCFKSGDQLVVIAQTIIEARRLKIMHAELKDQSQIVVQAFHPIEDLETPQGQLKLGPGPAEPKTILVIGCPPDLPDFLEILDCYLAPGSDVHVLSSRSAELRADDLRNFFGEVDVPLDGAGFLKRVKVSHHYGPTTGVWALKQLPLGSADCAIVLSECTSATDTALGADSRCLSSVITLRSLVPKSKERKKLKVVTELIHPKSNLVVDGNNTVRKHGSFVYSTSLETGVFALAAQDKSGYCILLSILNPSSPAGHIAAFSIESFVRGSETLSYFDLHARVFQTCGGILLGWRRSTENYPVMNPPSKDSMLSWSPDSGDEIIVFCSRVASDGRTSCAHSEATHLDRLRVVASKESESTECSSALTPPGCLSDG